MHGRAERGHVVHPYQQLAVSEDIAEGHDRRDNREELALVNLLLLLRAETVHPRKDVVRHLAAAHVAGVGEGIGHHNTEPLATTLTILSIRVDQQPTARGCTERPPERGQKLKEGPEKLVMDASSGVHKWVSGGAGRPPGSKKFLVPVRETRGWAAARPTPPQADCKIQPSFPLMT
jgi:hypothetical protein